MKVITYNVYGVPGAIENVPKFEERLKNLEKYLEEILYEEKPNIICFQEVNCHNLKKIESIMENSDYESGEYYYLKNPNLANQLNPIFYKKGMDLLGDYCLGHTSNYDKNTEQQKLLLGISDFRGTTINVLRDLNDDIYIIGNTHTDYISSEGKKEGIRRSIIEIENLLKKYPTAIPILLGDMNMVAHMAETYQILKLFSAWTTKSKEHQICSQSYHGYNNNEAVNCDFAFVRKEDILNFSHKILTKKNIAEEPSDHRPVIYQISNICQ